MESGEQRGVKSKCSLRVRFNTANTLLNWKIITLHAQIAPSFTQHPEGTDDQRKRLSCNQGRTGSDITILSAVRSDFQNDPPGF